MIKAAPDRAPLACFFSHSGHRGGAELCLLEQVARVSQAGIRCHVILPAEGPLAAELRARAVPVTVAPLAWWACLPGPSPTDEGLMSAVAGSVAALLPLLRELDPDLICTQTSVIPEGGLIARMLGKPHLWYVDEYGEADHGLRFLLGERARYRFMARHATRLVFSSSTLRRHAIRQHAGLAATSLLEPYGLRAPAPEPAAPPRFRRADSLKLALLGTVQAGKGQADALLAMGRLCSLGADIELILAGATADPAYRAALERMAAEQGLQDHVQWSDFLPRPANLLAEADALLMCSRCEAYGRITAEAMLMGKPVIGLNAGGTAELIQDGVNGLLYQPGDLEGLARAIQRLAADRPWLAQLGAAAQASSLAQRSEAANGPRLLATVRGSLDAGAFAPASAPSQDAFAATVRALTRAQGLPVRARALGLAARQKADAAWRGARRALLGRGR